MSVLETAREGRVLRLALNRPEKKNALSTELCFALADTLDAAMADASVGAILLEAKGDVFCTGMDLTEVAEGPLPDLSAVHERLFTSGMRLTKPLVAAVSGPALGGGIGLIANAHVAVAAQGCSFGLTEIRVGMWPFLIWRSVVSAIGERRALALALTGRIFSVNEALQWGLVHEVAPAFELDDRATATAHHLAEAAPMARHLGLRFASEARSARQEEAGELARVYRERAFISEDFREGVAAFQEKRRPVWNYQEE